MRTAYDKAETYAKANSVEVSPRVIRASNGEVAIVYDIRKNGITETKLSLVE